MKFSRDGGTNYTPIRVCALCGALSAACAGRVLHAFFMFWANRVPSFAGSGRFGCGVASFGLMSPLLSAARMKVEGKKEGALRGSFLLELLLPRAFRFRAAVFCIAMCSVAASIAVVVRLLGQGRLVGRHVPNGARLRCAPFAFCRHRSHLLSPTGCVPKSPIIAVLLNMRGTKRCAERDKVRNEARC